MQKWFTGSFIGYVGFRFFLYANEGRGFGIPTIKVLNSSEIKQCESCQIGSDNRDDVFRVETQIILGIHSQKYLLGQMTFLVT
jgi:hypothetical protein